MLDLLRRLLTALIVFVFVLPISAVVAVFATVVLTLGLILKLYDAIAKTREIGADILICDTAGRLHNKKYLMDELFKIKKVIENL